MNLIKILYPNRCPICETILGAHPGDTRIVCLKCNEKLNYTKSPRCFKCGKQLYSEDEEYCLDCRRINHEFVKNVGLFAYDDKIKYSMYRFKYKNQREYAKFFANQLASRYGHQIRKWCVDAIIPVPMYKIKQLKRGYNQAELVAIELSKALEIPVDISFLIRTKKTKPMKELNDEQRFKNLENAFIISKNNVKYKKVLLVDDIYTTGATMDECARTLKAFGIEEVYCASVCIGNGF